MYNCSLLLYTSVPSLEVNEMSNILPHGILTKLFREKEEALGLLEHYLHTIYFSKYLFNKRRPSLFTQGTIQYHVVSKLLLLINMLDFTFISVHRWYMLPGYSQLSHWWEIWLANKYAVIGGYLFIWISWRPVLWTCFKASCLWHSCLPCLLFH